MAPTKTSKSKTSESSETVSAPAPVVAASVEQAKVKTPKVAKVAAPKVETVVAAPAPVETKVKTPKAPKAEKVSAPKAEKVVAPKVETQEPSTEDAAVAELEASITAQSVEFMSKLNQLSSMIASLKTEYRNLEKKWSRELKTAQKSSSKKRKRTGSRAPSGFVKPTRISDELASFLGKDKGTEMARTDVTREINKYIRSQNLQDSSNGRKINPDSKLQTLLKLKKTDELTYFNLQRYMSQHFQKAEKPAGSSA
jgi:chromatin remodeling complex protein RSC6